jgi:hypothetical protein
VRGDLDSHTAAQFWRYLCCLIGQGHHHLVLDLGGSIFIDAAGRGNDQENDQTRYRVRIPSIWILCSKPAGSSADLLLLER